MSLTRERRAARFNSAFAGPRRKLASNGTTTILDNYSTNDLNNPLTSSTQTLNTLYQIRQYFTQQGKHYIHTTILPRLSSLEGFQTLANEIFHQLNFEGRRRQVNNVLLGITRTAVRYRRLRRCSRRNPAHRLHY